MAQSEEEVRQLRDAIRIVAQRLKEKQLEQEAAIIEKLLEDIDIEL